MSIDIRKDLPRFRQYLEERMRKHLKGRTKSRPVLRIDFGFEFGQGNWVALVFDTREDAQPDGEWSGMIKESEFLENPHWPIWHKLPETEQVSFINLAGKKINVMKDPDNLICKIVGDALKHILITARDEGFFRSLPKGNDAIWASKTLRDSMAGRPTKTAARRIWPAHARHRHGRQLSPTPIIAMSLWAHKRIRVGHLPCQSVAD